MNVYEAIDNNEKTVKILAPSCVHAMKMLNERFARQQLVRITSILYFKGSIDTLLKELDYINEYQGEEG